MENQIQSTQPQCPQEEEGSSIDFGKLFDDLKKHKRLFYWTLPITFVVVALITICIPNYYNCSVMLAPELSGKSGSSSLADLAKSFGVNMNLNTEGMDAINPMLYPDLMGSVDFKTSLFPVMVPYQEDEDAEVVMMPYYDYLTEYKKAPWWSKAMKATMKAIISLFKDEEETTGVDPFRLTKQQMDVVEAMDDIIACDVDKKTLVISISVKDTDPLICAIIADTVKTRLQNFITDYRTSKASVDLGFYEKLYEETRAEYEEAQKKYAEFVDANNSLILARVQAKQTALANEMSLRYAAYQQMAQQLQMAKAKVQEETPAFTTLQSATVPVKKAGPKRSLICLACVFLAFLVTSGWILYKEDDLKPLLGLS